MTTRAVLFDLDGVLCSTPDLHYRALNAALVDNGCSRIEPKQHEELYDGLPTVVKLQMLQERGLVHPDNMTRVSDAKKVYTRKFLVEEVKFDPAVFCLVHGVVGYGLKWGVVTNAVAETALTCLTLLKLPVPGCLVTNEDAPPKPAPAPYELACRRLGVGPREVLVVEDGDHGVRAAILAGCKVFRVSGPGDLTPDNVWKELGSC